MTQSQSDHLQHKYHHFKWKIQGDSAKEYIYSNEFSSFDAQDSKVRYTNLVED